MPNYILNLILKGEEGRDLFESIALMLYWNKSNPYSREWRYAYKLKELFK